MLLALLAAGSGSGTAAAQGYTITDLGPMDVYGINRHGQVVGSLIVPGPGWVHAALYEGGRLQDLGTLGGLWSVAYGINSAGQVVGFSTTGPLGPLHAFLYSGGAMRDLDTGGGEPSVAYAINDAGQIVGSGFSDETMSSWLFGVGTGHAFLSEGKGLQDLGTLGGQYSIALGINDMGQIVGSSVVGYPGADGWPVGLSWRGFVVDRTGMHDVPSPFAFSYAWGINNRGQVVGAADTPFGQHAFLYDGGEPRDLGTLGGWNSKAHGINDQGSIVGWSEFDMPANSSGEPPRHAFLYRNEQMIDLNWLLPPGSGWVLTEARAINPSGQIVGQGTLNGQPRGFLLTPSAAGPALPLPGPTHLAVSARSPHELDLTWTDNNSDEQGFEIQRQWLDNGIFFPWWTVKTVAANAIHYADTGLGSYGFYSYRVRALTPAGPSPWSNVVDDGTDFMARAKVRWEGPDFGAVSVGKTSRAGFIRITNPSLSPLTLDGFHLAGPNAAEFALADAVLGTVNPGESRRIPVTFSPRAGGARSALVLIMDKSLGTPHTVTVYGTGVLPPPPAPTRLAAKALSPQQVELTWTGGSPDVTAFAIWRKVGGGEFQRYSGVTGSVTRFVDRPVSPNTPYTYRVRANGPGGISAWSNEATVTPRLPPPAAPTDLTIRALSPTQMELRWTDNSGDATAFAIWRQSGGSDWARVGGVPASITRFVDRSQAPGTTYTYRVRANGPGGISAWSNEATGITLPASPGTAREQR